MKMKTKIASNIPFELIIYSKGENIILFLEMKHQYVHKHLRNMRRGSFLGLDSPVRLVLSVSDDHYVFPIRCSLCKGPSNVHCD